MTAPHVIHGRIVRCHTASDPVVVGRCIVTAELAQTDARSPHVLARVRVTGQWAARLMKARLRPGIEVAAHGRSLNWDAAARVLVLDPCLHIHGGEQQPHHEPVTSYINPQAAEAAA